MKKPMGPSNIVALKSRWILSISFRTRARLFKSICSRPMFRDRARLSKQNVATSMIRRLRSFSKAQISRTWSFLQSVKSSLMCWRLRSVSAKAHYTGAHGWSETLREKGRTTKDQNMPSPEVCVSERVLLPEIDLGEHTVLPFCGTSL
jgi:hypothetical protein